MDTITRLSLSNIKKEKSRSILIILSIMLTTLMLTVIATFCYGLLKVNGVNASAWYGSFYGSYSNVTEENLKQMELHSEFSAIGKVAALGEVETELDLTLYYGDEMSMEMRNYYSLLLDGKYPQSGNEIAAQPAFFRELGYKDPKVGDAVTISYRTDYDSFFAEDTFIISGLIQDSEADIKITSFPAYVSREYYEGKIAEEKRIYRVYFRLDESLGITSANAEDFMKEIAVKCGIDKYYVSQNTMYLYSALNPGTETILGCIAIAAVVVLFSVLVIYNIFQVGIVRKVQEYGRLKAVGATRRQMKKLIFQEGVLLSAIGIPAGVLSGYFAAVVSFRIMISLSDRMKMIGNAADISLFSAPILLLAALTAMLTVWAALKKPMKIVAGISPVEAMRYQEHNDRKMSIRKGNVSLSVGSLTMANLSANKKRTISTIVTMGLSCILFVALANFIGSMDAEYDARQYIPYGQFAIELDYSLTDTAYPENNLDSILKENPLDEELITQIEALEGVTGIKTRKILVVMQTNKGGNEEEKTTISVLSREDFEKALTEGSVLGEFTYDSVSSENGIIYGWSYWLEPNGYALLQEESLVLFDGVQEMEWNSVMLGAFGSTASEMNITEDTYEKLGLSNAAISTIWVDCADADIAVVQEGLSQLLAGKEHVGMTAYQDALKSSQFGIQFMQIASYIFCFLVALISFMNMANTLITSIITRKQEFGVLQAIGMTNKQLNKSLQLEGLLFTVGTLAISLLLGIPIGYSMVAYGKENSIIGLHTYRFPLPEIVLMITALALLQTALSFILSRNVKKESLVERIRYQE